MTPPPPANPTPHGDKGVALLRAKQALRLACAELPHLAGLARLARLKASRFFPVAAVSSSGLLCITRTCSQASRWPTPRSSWPTS